MFHFYAIYIYITFSIASIRSQTGGNSCAVGSHCDHLLNVVQVLSLVGGTRSVDGGSNNLRDAYKDLTMAISNFFMLKLHFGLEDYFNAYPRDNDFLDALCLYIRSNFTFIACVLQAY